MPKKIVRVFFFLARALIQRPQSVHTKYSHQGRFLNFYESKNQTLDREFDSCSKILSTIINSLPASLESCFHPRKFQFNDCSL